MMSLSRNFAILLFIILADSVSSKILKYWDPSDNTLIKIKEGVKHHRDLLEDHPNLKLIDDKNCDKILTKVGKVYKKEYLDRGDPIIEFNALPSFYSDYMYDIAFSNEFTKLVEENIQKLTSFLNSIKLEHPYFLVNGQSLHSTEITFHKGTTIEQFVEVMKIILESDLNFSDIKFGKEVMVNF